MDPARKQPRLVPVTKKRSGVRPKTAEPLVRWLIRAYDDRANATLSMWSDNGGYRVHLRHGVVTAVEVPSWEEHEIIRATSVFAVGMDAHIQMGPPTSFDEIFRVSISPLDLITRGLRALSGRYHPEDLLAALRGRQLVLHDDVPIDQLGLLRFEMNVVDALRAGPCTLAELASRRIVHQRALAATLFILQELRFFVGASGPPVSGLDARPSAAPAPVPPAGPRGVALSTVPTTQELETELRAMAARSCFEILGVEPTATDVDVESALAKKLYEYHPERLAPAQRRLALRICRRLGEAARQASDPDTRARHQADMSPEVAETLLVEARGHIRARRFHEAESVLLRMLERREDDPNARMLLAWCQAESLGPEACLQGAGRDALERPLNILRSVVRDHPKHVRARYFFAQLLRRSGRIDGAMRQFRIVVDLAPQHVGARRELRLHEMHRRKSEAGKR